MSNLDRQTKVPIVWVFGIIAFLLAGGAGAFNYITDIKLNEQKINGLETDIDSVKTDISAIRTDIRALLIDRGLAPKK